MQLKVTPILIKLINNIDEDEINIMLEKSYNDIVQAQMEEIDNLNQIIEDKINKFKSINMR